MRLDVPRVGARCELGTGFPNAFVLAMQHEDLYPKNNRGFNISEADTKAADRVIKNGRKIEIVARKHDIYYMAY